MILINFILFFLSYSCFAVITETQVLESVEKHFPLIQEALLKYQAAEQELIAGQGNFDHKLKFKTRNNIENVYDNQYFETSIERKTPYYGLGLIAGHRQGTGKFAQYDGFYKTSSAGELFAGITMPLLRNFSLDQERLDVRISHLNKEIAKEELRTKKLLTSHKALSLYYKWILESKKLQIRKDILNLAIDRQSMMEKKFKAGDVEKIKINDNQRTIDKRRDEVLKSEIDLRKISTEFSLYFRNDQGISLVPSINDVPVEPLVHKSIEAQTIHMKAIPQINIINSQLKILNEQKSFYNKQQLPGLNVDLLASRELSGNAPYDPEAVKVGVSFDFPLENRKAEGKTVANEYKLRAIEKQKDFVEQELKQYYDFSVLSMQQSLARYEIVTREFENTKVMAEAEKKRWLQGESDLFIFNLREQDVAEADIKRWSTLLDSQQYYIDAKLFSGTLVKVD